MALILHLAEPKPEVVQIAFDFAEVSFRDIAYKMFVAL